MPTILIPLRSSNNRFFSSNNRKYRNRLDLLIRKTETPVARTTYEFWIKELFNDSYERLIERNSSAAFRLCNFGYF